MATRTRGIMFVIPWDLSHQGGVNEVVRNLIGQCCNKGFRPIVLIPRWDCVRPIAYKEEGISHIRCRLMAPPGKSSSFKYAIQYRLYKKKQLNNLSALIKEYDIDVINVHYVSKSAFVFCELKSVFDNLSLILSFHGNDLNNVNISDEKNDCWGKIVKAANGISVCSVFLRNKLASTLRVDERVITVAYNGIDPAKIDLEINRKAQPGSTINGIHVVSIGTYEGKKGQDVLLKSCKRLVDDGIAVKLTLLGRDTDYREYYAELIKSLQLDEIVTVMVNVSHGDSMRVLADADIFVLPSREEAFGIVLLEAGYLGVPIVATNVGGIPEVIDDAGILVNSDDVVSMTMAIKRLIECPALSSEYRSKMKLRVIKKFTWKHVAQTYFSLYR